VHAAADRADKLVNRERLPKDAGHVHVSEIVARSRDDDDRDLATDGLRGELLLDRQTVEDWQAEIEYDEIRSPLLEDPQCLDTVARLNSVEPFKPERSTPQHP